MTHLACPVSTCDSPRRGDQQICGACAADLRRALEAVVWLEGELLVTMSRQTPRAGGGSERPLPYDVRASQAAGALRVTLVGWVRVLDDEPDVGNGLADMGQWLLERFGKLVQHAAAQEMCEEICDVVRQADEAVDRRPERAYAGQCAECQTHMYAKAGRAMVRCPGCEATYSVAERREWLMNELHDYLAHSVRLSRLVGWLGLTIADSTIRWWAGKRRIVAHGTDSEGRPLYRLGEVVAMHYAAKEAREAKAKSKCEKVAG